MELLMAASPILDMARTKCSQTEGTLCYSPWHQIQASTRTSQWSMASRSNNSPEFTASTSAARETYETYPKSCPRARGLSGFVGIFDPLVPTPPQGSGQGDCRIQVRKSSARADYVF